jgi:hypothetical protein
LWSIPSTWEYGDGEPTSVIIVWRLPWDLSRLSTASDRTGQAYGVDNLSSSTARITSTTWQDTALGLKFGLMLPRAAMAHNTALLVLATAYFEQLRYGVADVLSIEAECPDGISTIPFLSTRSLFRQSSAQF